MVTYQPSSWTFDPGDLDQNRVLSTTLHCHVTSECPLQVRDFDHSSLHTEVWEGCSILHEEWIIKSRPQWNSETSCLTIFIMLLLINFEALMLHLAMLYEFFSMARSIYKHGPDMGGLACLWAIWPLRACHQPVYRDIIVGSTVCLLLI